MLDFDLTAIIHPHNFCKADNLKDNIMFELQQDNTVLFCFFPNTAIEKSARLKKI